MKKPYSRYKNCVISCVAACACITGKAMAQQDTVRPNPLNSKQVVAGKQYSKSPFHQWLWGKHYRSEWTTPVTVPVLYLDTVAGGLTPYRTGGGRQSKNLHLHNPSNKEYVLRSIDKSFGRALPEIYRGTFIEKSVNDQVSIAHPYSAITIPPMAAAVGIYHTNPIIRYVPKQKALDTFNNSFGNDIYLLEQRPDENWEEAANFGNASNIISTEKLLQKLLEDNDNLVDQEMYVRARLFDMYIGDWGRHEDQWRWAAEKQGEKTLYKPIPRDRDQAYTKFDGIMLRMAISAAGLKHLQSFDNDIKDIASFNFPARNLDRRMANETDLEVWVNTAQKMQQALTDEVIEYSIRLLPQEVYANSGEKIISILKSRRGKLVEFATDYYKFLADAVDIPGSGKNEMFEITRVDDKQVKVRLYKISKKGNQETEPYYERVFSKKETKEIRLYGIAGSDDFRVADDAKKIIKLRILPNDTVAKYIYNAFVYDRKLIKPTVFFSNYDRFFAGVGYTSVKQGWRNEPFASQHSVYGRYSITQNAISVGYQGIINHAIGKWDLHLSAEYDMIRWTNFFGVGNETVELPKDFDYYRVRTRELYAGVGFNRRLGASSIRFTPFYQATRVINDEGRLLSEITARSAVEPRGSDGWDNYAGISVNYTYANINDPVVPTKGVSFSLGTAYTKSLETNRSINTYFGTFNIFQPITRRLSLNIRNGAATMSGDPKFYQLYSVGGSQNLRGYRRDRFRGRTAIYNNNELQYLFDFKSFLFNGKMGPLVFYDIGRVWQPGENSNTWHSGYGAGIMIAPFNRFSAGISLGISNENKVFHLRLSRAL
jgi:hypothetical protein